MEYKNVRHKLNTHSRDFNLFLTDVNCSLCERNCSVSSLQLLSWNIFVLHSMSCHPSQSTGRWPIQPAIQAVRHLASLPMTGPSAAATVVHQSRASVDHVACPRDDDRNSGMPKCQNASKPECQSARMPECRTEWHTPHKLRDHPSAHGHVLWLLRVIAVVMSPDANIIAKMLHKPTDVPMANASSSNTVAGCPFLRLRIRVQVASTTLFHLNLILIYAQRPALLLLVMPIAIFRKLATAMARTFRIPDVAPGFWPGSWIYTWRKTSTYMNIQFNTFFTVQ